MKRLGDTLTKIGKHSFSTNNDITIFDHILSKKIPSNMVYEDEKIYAFRDINPQAKTHVLIIPK